MEQSDRKETRRHYRPRSLRSLDEDGKMWDAYDVADYLKVSVSWVYKAAAEGTIPCLRLRGLTSVRFDPKLIKAYASGQWKPANIVPLKAG